jgi:uncharacterized protein (TIGR00645 family)
MGKKNNIIERTLEKGLFASRWLMAPFYVGLTFALLILLINFIQELFHTFTLIPNLTQNNAILAVLSLIDLSLAGNLLLIVIFSGYENFVSKMDIKGHEDEPEWMGTVDFSTLKLRLVGSIVAISGIQLLKVFMNIGEFPESKIYWMLVLHIVFIISGVLLALMDLISAKTRLLKSY